MYKLLHRILQYLHYLHTKLIKYEYTLQEELPYMIV